ncbi:zinc metalloproteinase-disintegrin-like VLAIP-B [Rhipicephalus sanguineus]|uniref:zinc metalloproteinase-disintegrin-like VLAIP-B n=1 Tax=Rhipicephalus sanguineus TaxID=34632 RepID=UPI0020C5A4D4|nr:zinc metalloproteinase-disintegrin-like VLAIP-B [Rhipicephalus sanguineus]
MEGLVNHTYRIEPLFEAERSDRGQIAHKLYTVQPHEANFNESISAFDPPPQQFKVEARADLPKVFRPDVFLISDYEHSRHFATLQKLIIYLVIFFNGVKLRYESVRYVSIVPRLVGVERAEWGQDSYEIMYGKDMIAESTLTNFQSYVEGRLRDFVGADAVMLVTGHSMVSAKLIIYLVIFFNGVKLRYESVRYVSIVPRLVGVERAEWGHDFYEIMYGKDMIAENTLTNFQSYVEGRLSDFVGADAVMLVTGHSMVSVSTGRIRPGVAGLAMTGGMCTRRRVGESLDIGRRYAGVAALAHELAHIMGSSHDQAAPVPNIPGNQGAYHCLWSDGYLMSYVSKDERQFSFSSCSQEQFVAFLMYVPQSCIENTWKGKLPKTSKRLPGDTFSRKKFCRRHSGFANSKECKKRHGDDLCKINCCPGKDTYGRDVGEAEIWCLDGANCGKNRECYGGYCKTKRRE